MPKGKRNVKAFTKVAGNIKNIKEQVKKNKIIFAVTYTAPYAAKIHEDLEMPHSNGQAKFLEKPLRENAKRLSLKVKELVASGKTLRQALLIVGHELLEISQALVPVDTGNLRDSGKVKIIK